MVVEKANIQNKQGTDSQRTCREDFAYPLFALYCNSGKAQLGVQFSEAEQLFLFLVNLQHFLILERADSWKSRDQIVGV